MRYRNVPSALSGKADSGPSGVPDFRKLKDGLSGKTFRYMHGKPYLAAHAPHRESASFQDAEILYAIAGSTEFQSFIETHCPRQYAVNRCIENSTLYGDILLGVTGVELPQTLNMVRNIFYSLLDFILEVYKGVKNLRPSQVMDAVSNAWMQYRYGWTPLIYEVEALKGFLTEKSQDYPFFGTRGSEKFSDLPQLSSTITTVGGDIAYTVDVTECFTKATMLFTNNNASRNTSSAARLGLDLESITSTAYELIPFSFVLDMFLNVGDYLNTFDFRKDINSFNEFYQRHINCIVNIEETTITSLNGYRLIGAEGFTPSSSYKAELYSRFNRNNVGARSTFSNIPLPEVGSPNYFLAYDVLSDLTSHYPIGHPQHCVVGDVYATLHPDVLLATNVLNITDIFQYCKGEWAAAFEVREYYYTVDGVEYTETVIVKVEPPPLTDFGTIYNAEADSNLLNSILQSYPKTDSGFSYRFDGISKDELLVAYESAGGLFLSEYLTGWGTNYVVISKGMIDFVPQTRTTRVITNYGGYFPRIEGESLTTTTTIINNRSFNGNVFQRMTIEPFNYELVPTQGLSSKQELDLVAIVNNLIKSWRQ